MQQSFAIILSSIVQRCETYSKQSSPSSSNSWVCQAHRSYYWQTWQKIDAAIEGCD